MRVIKSEPQKEIEQVCPNCRCLLGYVPADVHDYKRTDISGCTDTYYEITCPKCGKSFNVSRPPGLV